MKVRYSDSAKVDLRTAINRISNDSPSAARKLNKAIREAAAALKQNARRGQRADLPSNSEIRRLVVVPYLIFYEIEGRSVTILRILHDARDIPAVLKKNLGRDGRKT